MATHKILELTSQGCNQTEIADTLKIRELFHNDIDPNTEVIIPATTQIQELKQSCYSI